MRIAYFDCSWGISADTLLGALLDVGAPLDALKRGLRALPVQGYQLEIEKVAVQGVEGTCVSMRRDGGTSSNGIKPHISQNGAVAPVNATPCPPDARQLIACSDLPAIIKQTAGAAVMRLARCKGETCACEHGCTFQRGVCKTQRSVTSVGVMLALSLLEVDRVECSPLNTGGGFVQTERGLLPGLAPATAQLLRLAAAPVYGGVANRELVTPCGAAIITTIASAFGPMPLMKIQRTGYGVGREDAPGGPGLLRVIIGEPVAQRVSQQLEAMPTLGADIQAQGSVMQLEVWEREPDAHQWSGRQTKV